MTQPSEPTKQLQAEGANEQASGEMDRSQAMHSSYIDENRDRIEGIQRRVEDISGKQLELREKTNKSIVRLHYLKKERSEKEELFRTLANKEVGLEKLRKKKDQNIRVLTQKISLLEQRFKDREEAEARKEVEERDRILKDQSSLKQSQKGYMSTELIRLKRKLDHEILMDNIRTSKKKNVLRSKEEQEEQKELIEMRRQHILQENKNRMLDIQYRTKVSKLSLKRYQEQITEKTLQRVEQERFEQARLAREAERRIKTLQKKTDIQLESYLETKETEFDQKKKYELMLERSQDEHRSKIEALRTKSQIQQSLRESQLEKHRQELMAEGEEGEGSEHNKSAEAKKKGKQKGTLQ
jgi:hypothetical protein